MSCMAPRACGLVSLRAHNCASACGRLVPVRTSATACAAPSRLYASESPFNEVWKLVCKAGFSSRAWLARSAGERGLAGALAEVFRESVGRLFIC
jgi:hypothetical protein